MAYVHELRGWPTLTWHEGELSSLLANVRHKQGKLLGRTEDLGCDLRRERAALFNRRSQRSDFTYHITYHAGMAQGLFRPFSRVFRHHS